MSVCFMCELKPPDAPCPHHLHRMGCPKWAAEKTAETERQARISKSKHEDSLVNGFLIEGNIARNLKKRREARKFQVK